MWVGKTLTDLFGDGDEEDRGDRMRDAMDPRVPILSARFWVKGAVGVLTHKVATTKLIHAKTRTMLNRPIPSTPRSRTLLRSSSKPEERTARPRAEPDMAIKTMDHWKE